jgi:hypothetical protein
MALAAVAARQVRIAINAYGGIGVLAELVTSRIRIDNPSQQCGNCQKKNKKTPHL